MIEYIQIHPDYDIGMRNPKNALIKAIKIGIELIQSMIQEFGNTKHEFQNRFFELSVALSKSNPLLRLALLEEKIPVKDFIQMSGIDLANDE